MESKTTDRYLRIIATFKLIKGLLFLIVSVGVLSLLHKDLQAIGLHLVDLLHGDPDNRTIAALLTKLSLLNAHRIEELSGFTFLYGVLFLTESGGLYLKKRWAEYLTVIATASLIPVEIYELLRQATVAKVGLLTVNLAILWFLIGVLRTGSKKRNAGAAA